MSTLICGSVAYDNIMVFQGRFREHILPEQIHILNISFLVPQMRREYGGCAANIAYNLMLLGGDPIIMATVGDDAGPYRERLDSMGISHAQIRQIPGTWTPQCFITTDLDANQITAFHPGAMSFSHMNKVDALPAQQRSALSLAIVSPDGREGMISHIEGLARAGIPFIFDPGQAIPLFSGAELLAFVEQATYICVNDYEANLVCDKTGLSLERLADKTKALIVTRGAQGAWIFADGQRIDIPCVQANPLVDPTGCGDAFRAGLLYGIDAGWNWRTSGQLGALMGAIKIASQGPQNHVLSRNEIAARYQTAFGESLPDL